jgi:outer membrane protein TolC
MGYTKPVMRRVVAFSIVASAALWAAPVRALQPVTEFLARAKTWNPQNRAAHATTVQRDAEIGVATGALWPSFSAGGTYTRNQYEVTTAALIPAGTNTMGFNIPTTVIQPQDQLDANLVLTLPIISVANWDRRASAKATLDVARSDEANTELSVQKSVLRDYYTLQGDEAVLISAAKNVEVAAHHVQVVRDRKESGAASELDVQRALADEAKAAQSVTAAQLAVNNTRRELYSLSGLVAEPAQAFPADDLHEEEEPLASWIARAGAMPSVRSAMSARRGAELDARAARDAWLPTASASAQERFTNATAFIGGHTEVYLVQVSATWKLDMSIAPKIRAEQAAAAVARAKEDRVHLAAEDDICLDWQQIYADIESARSARAQVHALQLAVSLAEDRYEHGSATQLDVLQARQDAFAADVARIQADADLAYARMALRLDSGSAPWGVP